MSDIDVDTLINEEDESGYKPYISRKRRKAQDAQLREQRLAQVREKLREDSPENDIPERHNEILNYSKDSSERHVPEKAQGKQTTQDSSNEQFSYDRSGLTLLEQARRAMVEGNALTEEEKRQREEDNLVKQAMAMQKRALVAAHEHAQGIHYSESLRTNWTPPKHYLNMTEEEALRLRAKWHIITEGHDIVPPIKSFEEMKFPKPIIDALHAKDIRRPTPIQVQGLPVALSGRDMVGVAFTGSGKTMVFVLPMVMWALQEELRMPLIRNEGPIGVILCPSRELARQTYENVLHFTQYLSDAGYPELRTMLAIGGEDIRTQMEPVHRGVHMIVATPGRLNDHLNKKRITFELCKYIALDEADRMLDMGFDEDVQTMFSHFHSQRQTLLFSATMPDKVQRFAQETLVKPVVVNVGRAGAANLDVIQEVEYVKEDMKILYILECLQKTAPPVIIFAENKSDVDDINEYLLLKGIAAVSIHGGKSQEERNEAIRAFKDGSMDILIASDVAAKGLDFPDVQHVINFDMPKEIENYVHRIGRTGRRGKTGVATTFINRSVEERLLLDLKHLLMEAKQTIPPVLMALDDPRERENRLYRNKSCPVCGGLGHSPMYCPKLEAQRRQLQGKRKEYLREGGLGY